MLLSGSDMAGSEARLAKAIAAYAPPLSGPAADDDAIDQALCKVEHYAQVGQFYEAMVAARGRYSRRRGYPRESGAQRNLPCRKPSPSRGEVGVFCYSKQ